MLLQYFKNRSTSKDLNRDVAIARTYRPIMRGYFGIAALYYLLMTPTHFATMSGLPLALMAGASIIASIVNVGAWFAVRKQMAIGTLEALTGTSNLLMLANVMVALHIQFDQAKLVYFMIMVMVFALACVSIRQALISIAASLAGLFYLISQYDASQSSIYGYVAFGAAMSALSITFFLRRAIGISVVEKQKAENRLQQTQILSEEMRQRSLSDSLTGLPNRRAFFDVLQEHREEGRSDTRMWLALLDLDGFKAVNDIYGHLMGDELLKSVSNRMSEYCDGDAHLSRMGGDEFYMILSSDADEDGVEIWCQRLLAEIAEVYKIDERLIQVSGSIGCHEIVANLSDAKLIRNADYALLFAKKHGKNRVVVFREEHAKDAAERFKIEQALRIADFDAEIELAFQPQVDLGQDKIIRAEALARWDSPSIGRIGPDLFIKIAEETGLIANITLTVLKKAIAAIKSWDDPIPISINLSGHDLISDQIVDQIIGEVEQSGLAANLIEFEITETAMMSNTQKAGENMLKLSELGHPMALDDFGTGYSNFNYLRKLPINKLKIDRSFMENMGDPMTEKILHSLSGMAKTLGVDCLLEGVENELELLMAKRVGAQSVQGYHFGMPMNAVDLAAQIDLDGQLVAEQKWQEQPAKNRISGWTI